MLNFTRQERAVIYFLTITLGVGAILKIVRNRNLDAELESTRFYAEAERFKQTAAEINAGELMIIESSDDTMLVIGEDAASKLISTRTQMAKININTASAVELADLPGIGPAIAGRIRAYTDQNGPFKDKAEIILVKGIGQKLYTRIEGLVTIE